MAERSDQLDELIGSIPDTQLVIVPDPITGKLLRSTFGQMKTDIINAFGPISYLDPIVEALSVADLPNPGAIKTLYVITAGADENKQFRWSGSKYIEFPHGSDGDVSAEATIRGNEDIILQANITAEATARAAGDTTLQTNITSEATARGNADTTLQNNIDAEANARQNADNSLSTRITIEVNARTAADAALQSQIDLKLNAADYNDRYKGKYTSLSALQTAHAASNAGDYAQVDAGSGSNVINYNWDTEDGWVPGTTIGPTLSSADDLTEGTTNLYFTTARAQAAITGTTNRISVASGVVDISGSYIGQSSITTLGTIATGTWNGTAIAYNYGGTGFTSYSKGDIIYASNSNVLAKLGAGSDGQYLKIVSGVPAWADITAGVSSVFGRTGVVGAATNDYTWAQINKATSSIADITTRSASDLSSGTLAQAQGGTGFGTYAKGDLLYASAINTLSKLAVGSDGYVLTLASGVPTWAAGGSGLPSQTGNSGKYLTTDGTSTSWAISPTPWTISGANIYYNLGNTGIGSSTPVSLLNIEATSLGGASTLFATDAKGVVLSNPTVGSLATQQISPGVSFYANGWSAVSSGVSQQRGMRMIMQTSIGATSLLIQQSLSGGAYSTTATFASSGSLTLATNLQCVSGSFIGNIGVSGSGAGIYGAIYMNNSFNNNYAATFLSYGFSCLSNQLVSNALAISTLNCFYAAPVISNVATATNRGFYYNPSVSGAGVTTLIGFQNEVGNNLFGTTSGSVGIGANTSLNASAILDITSTTKGLLPPRMTTTQRTSIASPAEGLCVYDLTLHKLYTYDGSTWQAAW